MNETMKGYGQKRYLQKVIASLNRDDPSTTNVVLNGFRLSDAKIALLGMALVRNTHLATLHLDGNDVSDRGAVLLAYALKQNDTLEVVSLNDNRIGSSGADALACALHGNTSLRTLRLANNSIGDHGAKGLRKMMKRNDCIEEVVLEGNGISPKIANRFDARCRIERAKESAEECDDTAASTATLSHSTSSELQKVRPTPQEDLLDVSWENLASYMRTVQNNIDQRTEEENDSAETICSNDDDILSVASSQPDNIHATEGKQKKRWRIFKQKRQIYST